MPTPTTFLIEGIDRFWKDPLLRGLLDALGYHLVLHYQKPLDLPFYTGGKESRLRSFQEESFRTLLTLIANPNLKIIANRAHLGEVVYAPRYRAYDGEYVFELEHD